MIIYIIICILVGYFAHHRGRNGIGWFLLSLLISPLLSGIILACIKDLTVTEELQNVRMEGQRLKDRVVSDEKMNDYRFGVLEKEMATSRAQDVIAADPAPPLLTTGNEYPCPACGNLIKTGAIKCRHCGVMIDQLQTMVCPYCKETVASGSITCVHCKSYLKSAVGENHGEQSRVEEP